MTTWVGALGCGGVVVVVVTVNVAKNGGGGGHAPLCPRRLTQVTAYLCVRHTPAQLVINVCRMLARAFYFNFFNLMVASKKPLDYFSN